MKVFKFGGASVKDAESVKNVGSIISRYQDETLIIVVSAMGKTTNALEKLLAKYRNEEDYQNELEEIKDFHFSIINDLFGADQPPKIIETFSELEGALTKERGAYGFDYDRIISFGEMLSTQIIHHYLSQQGFDSTWHDTTKLISTNNHFRRATVNWTLTRENIQKNILDKGIHIVQGFIGSSENGDITTLGREGSDYTASVFAHCLDASDVTIWKDVPGILNGDPKVFDNTVQLEQISYEEAIELAYFGASVIHPKTIQPVQRKNIPLFVRSFVNPDLAPTSIQRGLDLKPMTPCYIKKEKQALIQLSTPDLAFIVENHLSKIYQIFHETGITVNMMQNSAVSTSFCVNDDPQILPDVVERLKSEFIVELEQNLDLFTVRHPNEQSINSLLRNRNVALEQITKKTVQLVVQREDLM